MRFTRILLWLTKLFIPYETQDTSGPSHFTCIFVHGMKRTLSCLTIHGDYAEHPLILLLSQQAGYFHLVRNVRTPPSRSKVCKWLVIWSCGCGGGGGGALSTPMLNQMRRWQNFWFRWLWQRAQAKGSLWWCERCLLMITNDGGVEQTRL